MQLRLTQPTRLGEVRHIQWRPLPGAGCKTESLEGWMSETMVMSQRWRHLRSFSVHLSFSRLFYDLDIPYLLTFINKRWTDFAAVCLLVKRHPKDNANYLQRATVARQGLF